MSRTTGCSPVPTSTLSAGSSSVPRHSSVHPGCSHTKGSSPSLLSWPVLPEKPDPSIHDSWLPPPWEPVHRIAVIPAQDLWRLLFVAMLRVVVCWEPLWTAMNQVVHLAQGPTAAAAEQVRWQPTSPIKTSFLAQHLPVLTNHFTHGQIPHRWLRDTCPGTSFATRCTLAAARCTKHTEFSKTVTWALCTALVSNGLSVWHCVAHTNDLFSSFQGMGTASACAGILAWCSEPALQQILLACQHLGLGTVLKKPAEVLLSLLWKIVYRIGDEIFLHIFFLVCRHLFHDFYFALRWDRLPTTLAVWCGGAGSLSFSQPHTKCRASRQEKKMKREKVVPFCSPFPSFLPPLFLRFFALVQMQVKSSESQLAKPSEPLAQSVRISSDFSFISPQSRQVLHVFCSILWVKSTLVNSQLFHTLRKFWKRSSWEESTCLRKWD